MKKGILILSFCLLSVFIQCSQDLMKDDLIVIQSPKIPKIYEQIDCKREACGAVLCCLCAGGCKVAECGCYACCSSEWGQMCHEWSGICWRDTCRCFQTVIARRYHIYQKSD